MEFANEFFKFKSIKTYGNTECLYNNEKKYRCVFDESEASYIYCELTLYNKKFDIEDWSLTLNLKCFDDKNHEICKLNCDLIVNKENNIFYIREGWGVQNQGEFWKKGEYKWEVYFLSELIAEKHFFIEKQGIVTLKKNSYLNIISASLFENLDNKSEDYENRKFAKEFDYRTTRFIYLNLHLFNKVYLIEDWICELFFYFKTSEGLLKGQVSKILVIPKDYDNFYYDIGWGSNEIGTWGIDYYYIDVVFMDVLIAKIPFEIYEKKSILKTLKNKFKLKPTFLLNKVLLF